MSDIDLIPQGWRDSARLRIEGRQLLMAAALLLLCAGGVRLVLAWRLDALRPQVTALRQAQAQLAAARVEQREQAERKAALEARLHTLDSLHLGGSVETIDRALQAALTPEVWLKELRFSRGDPAAPAEAVAAGKLPLPVARPASPEGAPAGATPDPDWSSTQHLEIHGQATSHGAVAGFVAALAHQAGIHDLRIRDTSASTLFGRTVVDFELLAEVELPVGDPR